MLKTVLFLIVVLLIYIITGNFKDKNESTRARKRIKYNIKRTY